MTYTVEGWFRTGTPGQQTDVSFTLNQFYNNPDRYPCVAAMTPALPFVFTATDTWQLFQQNFTIPEGCVIDFDSSVGQGEWSWRGPGELFMDNLRIYEASAAFGDWLPEDYAAMADSGMRYLRTHQFVKTGFSYTMEGFTNPSGGLDQMGPSMQSSWTLPSLLGLAERLGVEPWLQLEMCMDDWEWQGMVEFLCASYDPLVDTPASKPWAYKRYAQGRAEPWLDAFSKILFEISNETWNWLFAPWTFLGTQMPDSVTGRTVADGELYGLFQERVVQIMKSSPYWSAAAEEKFVFVIGGFAVQLDSSGFGQQAAVHSQSSKLMTVAGYNGGWERGIIGDDSPDGFMGAVLLNSLTLNTEAEALTRTQAALRESGVADFELGTYEAGPGYNINGLNGVSFTLEDAEAESRVMKSPAGGVATLDTFLYRARLGWTEQNFFTYGRNRWYWVSHAPQFRGGWAYPAWSALTMFNHYATGRFLLVNTVSVPTVDFSGNSEIPQITAYATSAGGTYNLFLLSKKLDYHPFPDDAGYTEVSVALPFYAAEEMQVVLLTSPWGAMASALDNDTAPLQSYTLQGADMPPLSPMLTLSLPPGSVYLYRFLGVSHYDPPAQHQVLISPVHKAVFYPSTGVRFRLSFSEPWEGFSEQFVSVSGSARASSAGVVVVMDPWSHNTSALVTVSDMREAGEVTVTVDGVSSTAVYSVEEGLPPAPQRLWASWADVDADQSSLVLQWEIVADIASYPQQAVARWGLSASNRTGWSSGVQEVQDMCPRCQTCASNAAYFCSTANLTVDTSATFSVAGVEAGAHYQDRPPLFFSVAAQNDVGASAEQFKLSVYQFHDDFSRAAYFEAAAGGLPTGWACLGDCSYAALEAAPPHITSPTGTPLLHFVHWAESFLVFQQQTGSPAGNISSGLLDMQHYTVRTSISAAETNGYNIVGVLSHFQDLGNYVRVGLYPPDGRFRIEGQAEGAPVYGPSVNLLADSGEADATTAMDAGEFWTLAVSTVAVAEAQWCGPAVEVRVQVLDEQGACRIDFGSDGDSSQAGRCVFSWLSCAFPGSHGTFGVFNRNPNGGASGDADRMGHFFDSFSVDAIPLI